MGLEFVGTEILGSASKKLDRKKTILEAAVRFRKYE